MEDKLALSDDILLNIEKPSRYIGNELNCTIKSLVKLRYVSACAFLMFMRLACQILVWLYFMRCLTQERIPGANVCTALGQILIRL